RLPVIGRVKQKERRSEMKNLEKCGSTCITPYAFSVQSVSCCFPMTGLKDGSVCVCFGFGKMLKGWER
ncbi:MAG: hypothetical protein ACETWE_14000, partial [Candidatus Bathyarchaeia archaeon]